MKRSLVTTLFTLTFSLSIAAPALADASPAARSEARERFDRAIRLVNAGDLSGGLAEFQRAYKLVLSPVVLYNLGLVYAALRRPVEAVKTIEQTLTHAAALNPEDVERARTVLNEQREQVGRI